MNKKRPLEDFAPNQEWTDSEDEDELSDQQDEEDDLKKDLFMSDDELDDEVKQDVEKDSDPHSSVVYLGRIPFGFFEEQMRGYFSQFGEVKNLRLSRNKKTGKSKHYAFIEFETPEVAKIVAESMHGYLLYGHKLQCRVVPKEKLHPDLFKGANRKFKKVPYRKLAKDQHNREKNPEEIKKTVNRLLKKEEKKRKKLKELGIDYDFGGYSASQKKTSTTTTPPSNKKRRKSKSK